MRNTSLAKEYEYTRNGELVVNMVVKDDTNFLSVFSDEDTPIISEDVSSFLENSTQSVPNKQPLALRIHSDCIDEQEKRLYERGIKKYYADRSVMVKRELKRNIWIAVILAMMGILTLVLAHTVEATFNSVIWAEAIDIAAWVLLWESVDILAFKLRGLRLDAWRYQAFCAMPIEYLPLKN